MKISTDKIISYSALMVSLGTLVVLIYQSDLMRRHEEKSVFPKVELWNSPGKETYSMSVINKGVGPAIIENVTIIHRENQYETEPLLFVNQYLDTLTNEELVMDAESLYPGVILAPNQRSNLFTIKRNIASDSLISYFYLRKIQIRISYSSIYGDQWTIDGIGALPIVEKNREANVFQQLMGN